MPQVMPAVTNCVEAEGWKFDLCGPLLISTQSNCRETASATTRNKTPESSESVGCQVALWVMQAPSFDKEEVLMQLKSWHLWLCCFIFWSFFVNCNWVQHWRNATETTVQFKAEVGSLSQVSSGNNSHNNLSAYCNTDFWTSPWLCIQTLTRLSPNHGNFRERMLLFSVLRCASSQQVQHYELTGYWKEWCALLSKTGYRWLDKLSCRRHRPLAWVELRQSSLQRSNFSCNHFVSLWIFGVNWPQKR